MNHTLVEDSEFFQCSHLNLPFHRLYFFLAPEQKSISFILLLGTYTSSSSTRAFFFSFFFSVALGFHSVIQQSFPKHELFIQVKAQKDKFHLGGDPSLERETRHTHKVCKGTSCLKAMETCDEFLELCQEVN